MDWPDILNVSGIPQVVSLLSDDKDANIDVGGSSQHDQTFCVADFNPDAE